MGTALFSVVRKTKRLISCKQLIISILLIPYALLAQRMHQTFHDAARRQVKEEFSTLPGDPNTLDGPYRRYYSNGKPELTGSFANGVRHGVFQEYAEDGTLRRVLRYREGMREGAVDVYDEKGRLLQRGRYAGNQLTDSIRTYFESGIVRMESFFQKGKPEGVVREYYPDGSPRTEIPYKNRKPNGVVKTWYPGHLLATEAWYTDGINTQYYKTYYLNGQLNTYAQAPESESNGSFTHFDSLGHRLLVSGYRGGQWHGDQTGYFATGEVRHKYQFRDGVKAGTNLKYYQNGKVEEEEVVSGPDTRERHYRITGEMDSERNYRQGKPHGKWSYFQPDGKTLLLTENYELGKLQGLRIQYHPNGKKSVEEPWLNNLITGKVRNYHPDGSIASECDFRSSRRHGLYTAWYPNGKIRETGEYLANLKNREWKEYDEQGNLLGSTWYRTGIAIPAPGN